MNHPKPTIEVCMHKTDRIFRLIHQAFQRRFGWIVAWDKPISLTMDEMRTDGLEIILQSLNEFSERDGDDETKVFRFSNASEAKSFDKMHDQVALTQTKPNEIHLTPMHRGKRGGFVGAVDSVEDVIVKLPCSPEVFYDRLMEAFEKCS